MRNRVTFPRWRNLCVACASVIAILLMAVITSSQAKAQSVASHPHWPGPGQLFVGTCYQPVDRTPEEIDRDIAIMKRAGFNVVRMGDRTSRSWKYCAVATDEGIVDAARGHIRQLVTPTS